MADRVSASISIGGTVTLEQWAILLELIANQDLRTEWDGPTFTAATPLESGALHLFAHEVPWGRFEALEQYACDQDIAYRRWSGGCPGCFGPEIVVFDGGGQNGPLNYDADEDERVVVRPETIERLGSIRAIRAYFKPAAFEPPPLMIAD
jgi:hypothetical protein